MTEEYQARRDTGSQEPPLITTTAALLLTHHAAQGGTWSRLPPGQKGAVANPPDFEIACLRFSLVFWDWWRQT